MPPKYSGPGPSPSEQVLFDVWDKIADLAERHGERAATAVAKAALYAIHTEIEKGTLMATTKQAAAPARNKELAVKLLSQIQPQRDKDEATGDIEGAELLTQAAALLLKYAGVADEPLLPEQQLDNLKRLAATTDHPGHRAHYDALVKVEGFKREYRAATAPRKGQGKRWT